jgi:lantibiotic leader peptide-processing serine protease
MKVRRLSAGAVAAATLLAVGGMTPVATAAPAAEGTATYTVLAEEGASGAAALAAIKAAGGTVTATNAEVGSYTVTASGDGFIAKVAASGAVLGAAHSRPIGYAPKLNKVKVEDVERENRDAGRSSGVESGVQLDPLDDKLWGLKMVRSDLARKVQPGDKRVKVGVLDTGIDASNPDIAPNFDWKLSRNFAKDIPDVDGPCEVASCLDPVGTDDGGHGSHVAGTIGAAANGFGLSGVAPNVSLVELKAGQDSGYFFLDSVVNGLVHAAKSGLDVVNMSFYVDPWLYNCLNNPADSAEAQLEQRTIIAAMSRALIYARLRGVTLVGSLGNNHEDLGAPRTDISSPDYPADSAYPRPIDNRTCFDLPIEGPGVIGVSALGPSKKKADYSNYGTEQISVSAPGGWFRDGFGTPTFRTNENMILSVQPLKVLQEEGSVDPAGNITPAGAALGVQKQCNASGQCGYYGYLQGTSMASPHVSGVAALIVSEYGHWDLLHPGGLTLSPWATEWILTHSAAKTACPEPRLQTYTNEGRSEEFNAYCAGDKSFNGFYGHGIVDAYAAVTR